MYKRLIALAAATLTAAVAWAGDVTQSRTVAPFQSVRLEGAAEVTLKVGPAASVTVTADEAVASQVTTEVKDGALVIGYQKGAKRNRGKSRVRVAITNPSLNAIALSGAGSIQVEGITGDAFRADLSGAGKLQADGSVRQLKVVVSGTGDVRLGSLATHAADVVLSGTGKVHVRASDSLQAQLSGVGEIRYDGNPGRVNRQVSGIGKVRAN